MAACRSDADRRRRRSRSVLLAKYGSSAQSKDQIAVHAGRVGLIFISLTCPLKLGAPVQHSPRRPLAAVMGGPVVLPATLPVKEKRHGAQASSVLRWPAMLRVRFSRAVVVSARARGGPAIDRLRDTIFQFNEVKFWRVLQERTWQTVN